MRYYKHILMFAEVFPIGINHYIIGGLLVGIGISIPFLWVGLVAGVSTVFTSTWSYLLSGSFFHRPEFRNTRQWRLSLLAGLVTGGFFYVIFFNNGEKIITEIGPIRLLIGGIIIGIGTRMSGGCTSGHGICGNASLSQASFVATIVFLSVGVFVAIFTSMFF